MSQTIVITGGASGIGRACVELFLRNGYKVGFCDNSVDEAEKFIEYLNSVMNIDDITHNLHFAQVDVRDKAALQSFAQQVAQKFHNISALFVNAGIHRSNTMLDISDEELKEMIDINLYGSIYTMQAVTPYLIKNGSGSIVINDSDQFFIGKPNNFGYGLTKGALGQMTRSLSVDLAKHKIRVNAVCSGTIRTPLADKALERYANRVGISLEDAWKEEDALFPLGSAGTANEVAEMVFFLTEKATFSTGGHYLVDGGLVAQ